MDSKIGLDFECVHSSVHGAMSLLHATALWKKGGLENV